MTRSPFVLLACTILPAALAMACASGLPAVLSSSPEAVSVEFSTEDNVSETKALADEACAKHARIPEFDSVQATASPGSRVAQYRCVSTDVAAPPPTSPPAAATTAPETSSSETPTE